MLISYVRNIYITLATFSNFSMNIPCFTLTFTNIGYIIGSYVRLFSFIFITDDTS